jgi:hypothetical protein
VKNYPVLEGGFFVADLSLPGTAMRQFSHSVSLGCIPHF